jgi:hypothetical protein
MPERHEDLRGAYAALYKAADAPTIGFVTDLLLHDAATRLRCAGEDALADEAEAAMRGADATVPFAIDSLLERVDALLGDQP